MKKLTDEEYVETQKLYPKIGGFNFCGGFKSDGTDKFLVWVYDEIWLCDKQDLDTKEYKELIERQNKQGEEDIEAYRERKGE